MSRLLTKLLLIFASTISINSSYALDLGKSLEDVVKEKIDAVKTDNTTSSEVSTAPSNPTTIDATITTQTAEKSLQINWKNPSREEEIALGREITGNLLGAAPLVKDEALQKYVNQVGRWVANQSERTDLPWRFGVVASNDINAFAAPGGYIVITQGLYQQLQNEAQLAAVLGHEIAHVTKKHQLKILQKQQFLGWGAKLLGDKYAKNNQFVNKAIGSGAEVCARGLDKDAEFEADRMGMVLATRAGYEPFALGEVLQVIGQTTKSDKSVALLFKTHPHPDERLVKLSDSAGNKLDKIKDGKTLENRFYKLQ